MSDCLTCRSEIPEPRPERKKYCNTSCYNSARPLLEDARSCTNCGGNVVIRDNRHALQRRVFCGLPCRNSYCRGENATRWNGGGTRICSDGYLYQRLDGRWKPEHVHIAERILGRRLQKGEVVHHINGIKTDNRNSNLLICDQKYHMWLHARMSALYQKEHFS